MNIKKSIISIFIVIVLIIVFVLEIYYLKYRNNTMICTYSASADIYSIKTKYTVSYKNKVVSNLKTEEIYTMNDKDSLKKYKKQLDNLYKPYNKLKHYNYSVEIVNNSVISKTNIDYNKIDMNTFKIIDPNNRRILKDDKVRISTLKSIYKKNGARCIYR